MIAVLGASGCLQNHKIFQDVEATEPDGGPTVRHELGEACTRDDDCLSGTVCVGETCSPCPWNMRCRDNFSVLARNGCTWCAPDNECISDSECSPGMVCFAGAQCPPGCNDDPRCCFGNLCSDPSCGPPPNLDCSRVGCADGSNCIGTGQVDGCACEPSTRAWDCMMREGQNECDHAFGGPPPGGGRM